MLKSAEVADVGGRCRALAELHGWRYYGIK